MNVTPHVHEVQICRYMFPVFGDAGYWVITYGDTTVYVHRGPWVLWRLKRGAAWAVRRHDQGSVEAGRRLARDQATKAAVLAAVQQSLPTNGWPSK